MTTRILHISDLHFGVGFREADRSLFEKLRLRGGLRGHDFQLVSALSAKIHRLAMQSGKFDLAVVTGDLSTDGMRRSMNNAAKLFDKDEIFSGSPGHFIVYGLRSVTNSVVSIPGNHDRYNLLPFQLNFGRFERVFLKNQEGYPYVIGIPGNNSGSQESGPVSDIVLFAFDSTAVNNPPFGLKPQELVARGYVDDAACDWLKIKSQLIKQSSSVQGLDGKAMPIDYDRAVKILLIHHHPIDFVSEAPPETAEAEAAVLRRQQITKKISEQWSTLENREAFVKACFESGVDIVLFGHQHLHLHRELDVDMRPLVRPDIHARSIHFLACPTTLQWADSEIGFMVYKIGSNQFEVDYYGWHEEEQKFERDRRRSGVFDLRRGTGLSVRAKAAR